MAFHHADRPWRTSLWVTAGWLLVLAATAVAQPEGPAAGPVADAVLVPERAASSSSIQVLSRADIERSGASNLRDLLSQLTANAGAPDALDMGIAGRSGVDSVAGFNLRGMGGGATLVLLNGRRMVPSAAPVREGTDVNAIPLAVVERVEVVRGGASALYGSNAIAGVINVITRPDFEGVHVEANAGSTSDLGFTVGHASVALGAVSEFGAVQFGAGYARQGALPNDARDFTRTIHQTSLFGYPGSYVAPTIMDTVVQDARCGQPEFPYSFRIPAENASDAAWQAQARRAGLSIEQLREERARAAQTYPWLADVCRFNFNPFFDLITPIERFNAFGSAVYELGRSVSMFAEVLSSRTESAARASPSFPANSIEWVDGHPGAPDDLGTDTSFRWLGRPFGGSSSRLPQNQESTRLVVGLRGELGDEPDASGRRAWQWEIAGSTSWSRYFSRFPDARRSRLNAALDADVCASDMEVPCLDPFREPDAATERDLRHYLLDEQTVESTTRLHMLDANVSGVVASLPAGPLGLALGGEVRRLSLLSRMDAASRENDYAFLVGSSDRREARNVGSVHGELDVPIVLGLTGQVALRMETYEALGIAANPKAGVWANVGELLGQPTGPLAGLRVRASVAQGNVAPNLLAMGEGERVLPSNQRYRQLPLMIPNVILSNRDLKLERAQTFSTGIDFQWLDVLFAELNFYFYNYTNAVIADDPRRILAECNKLDGDPRNACEGAFARADPFQRGRAGIGVVEFDQIDIPTRIRSVYRNGAQYRTTGLDFGLEGRLPLSLRLSDRSGPAFHLGMRATLLLTYELTERAWVYDPISDTLDRRPVDFGDAAGKRNYLNSAPALPRLRMRVPIGVRSSHHDLRLVGVLTSGFENDEPVDRAPLDGVFSTGETGHDFNPQLVFNLGYGFRTESLIGAATSIRLDVINIFDRRPPRRYTADGTDLSVYDPRGRMMQLSLSQDF